MAPENENEETYPDEIIVVGVKVRDLGEVKKTRTDDPSVKVGDWVLLDLDGDHTFGKVYLPPQHLPFTPPMRAMRTIIRKANEEDERGVARQQRLAQEGHDFCLELIETLGLKMKLVEVFGSFLRRSLTFTYTADSGVDTCGVVLCCSSFLTDFKPVYPRGRGDGPMSNMDSHRIGVCGRLKCCLLYEEEDWTLIRRKPPALIRPMKR
jgi:cell fate regulator YaaT (PSP1 superfamily)